MRRPRARRDENAGVEIYFSDVFRVSTTALDRYGAFNISLINDLPLFIDPFLLFNSRKRRYRKLHGEIIGYLAFLRDKSTAGAVTEGLLRAWYVFKEIHQNWLGFSNSGNRGSGLGLDFARALNANLHSVFGSFGKERVTTGSHLEKLCLIGSGVGRDHISDFTTNLIKGFLLEYTQEFARRHIAASQRKSFAIEKTVFNYETESWETRTYDLPVHQGEYVLLTPREILTRDDTWINRSDLIDRLDEIAASLPDESLRAAVNNYLRKQLSKRPTKPEIDAARARVIREFPQIIEYYIKDKELHGDRAVSVSEERVQDSERFYISQVQPMTGVLRELGFYRVAGTTHDEAHQRVAYLKDCIENKGCHRIFYLNGKPVGREEDVQILFRLVWCGTTSDVSREVNDGRGPADFKISKGAFDKTLVEFKLASNSQLERNLKNQAEVYQKASDAKRAIKVIVYRSAAEYRKVQRILKTLDFLTCPDIVLIDARKDNKPSGSKA